MGIDDMDHTALTQSESSLLFELESRIETGLQTFVEVGNALAEIRDARLYRQTHGTFEDYCRERWGMARNYANKMIAASEAVGNLGTIVPKLPATESQTRPLTRLNDNPELQRTAWREAVETAPNGKVTAAHVESVVQQYTAPAPARPHVSHNSGNNEWYTPPEFIDAARATMGDIDLDPASSETANQVVGARHFFTADDDGLAQEWRGRVWMNPPYASDLIGKFSDKICAEIASGRVYEAIVLVNNATETAWFQQMAEYSSAICFPRSRVKFWKPDGETGAPLQGQAVLYFGGNVDAFADCFDAIGMVLYAR